MHDLIGAMFDVLGNLVIAGEPDKDSPRWLQWGCAGLAVSLLIAILAVVLWPR